MIGPCYALKRLQRALIIMQNKLWSKRVQINKELSDSIAKPIRLNEQVMELTERIDLLLGMKERANGACYKAYNSNKAINIVNAHSESETAARRGHCFREFGCTRLNFSAIYLCWLVRSFLTG